jgi:hypothetical protein
MNGPADLGSASLCSTLKKGNEPTGRKVPEKEKKMTKEIKTTRKLRRQRRIGRRERVQGSKI